MLKQLSTLAIAALAALSVSAQSVETVPYTASSAVFCNPERGIFTHQEFHSGDNYALSDQLVSRCRQEGISIMFCGFVMEDYRNCMIPDSYLQRIRQNLATLRRGGMKAVVRFSYSFSESDKPWDCPWALTKTHIAQLRPILRENADVICLLEAGFVGVWGEWYYTENYNFEPRSIDDYKPRREVLDALLEAMPTDRFVAVRYPDAKLKTLNITYADTITAATAYDGSTRSRLSYHNDGFLATSDDYGTFQNKQDARKYWMQETRYVPMGGETAKLSTYCSVDNAAKQMANYHWSYINKDYHLDVIKKWREEGLYNKMERLIGYRFTLTEGHYPTAAQAGEPYALTLKLHNDGWAAPYNPYTMHIVWTSVDDPRRQYVLPVKQDIRFWQGGTDHSLILRMVLPADMPLGRYNVGLRIADATPSLCARPEYNIRLANDGMWDATTGINILRTVDITSTTGSTSPYGTPLTAAPLIRSVWSGNQTSVSLPASTFAQSQVGDVIEYVVPAAISGAAPATADCQRIESRTIDAALLATLQKSGLTAKASDGSRILAVRLVESATSSTAGIEAPTALSQPSPTTYDLLGRVLPSCGGGVGCFISGGAGGGSRGICITQGRKYIR